ncbi:aldehyde dehydrogenase [Bergeriella denitrificans]|uniref:Putative succinate-semialdehyde dehydrogenase n=1 Tax=Bergeriella denitrificans TaxID=494 RepID=A0A378UEY2_BERDE|nr:aldehyde dehydrogenase [Bergeriella denitrificans]STZ75896.1 putative succinate-semialdehyde dehydrogenase [Bergeriella denitrificans]
MKSIQEIFAAAAQGGLNAVNLIPDYAGHNRRLENRTPIDNSLTGYITDSGEEDVEAAVAAARKAFDEQVWAGLAPAERRKIMLKWSALIAAHSEELAALDCIDAGKPIDECLNTDLPATVETFEFYAEYLDKSFDRMAPTGSDALAMIVREPIGVVACVLPWNFPALMFAWKVAPALAAGNSVIVKPAAITTLSAHRMIELAYEAGVPQGALTLVCGSGSKVGRALGMHHDVDMVAFTGSSEVGAYFLEYSAQSNMKEVVLECGGKNPQIIFDDADLDRAVPHILASSFWNMGENCSSGSRILVDEKIKDKLVQKLSEAVKAWKVGDPREHGVSFGPMVEKRHFEKVAGYLDIAAKEGAKAVIGGRIRSDLGSGWYIEPTIFDGVTPEMTIFREEIFGPISGITTFQTEEEAVALANDTIYGLAASFYTQDLSRAHRVARKIRAGTVSVNGFSEGNAATPFGGYKQSGFGGRDKGVEAFEQYMQVKTVWFVG